VAPGLLPTMVSITIVISLAPLCRRTISPWNWVYSFWLFSSESPWEQAWYWPCSWSFPSDCPGARQSSSVAAAYVNPPAPLRVRPNNFYCGKRSSSFSGNPLKHPVRAYAPSLADTIAGRLFYPATGPRTAAGPRRSRDRFALLPKNRNRSRAQLKAFGHLTGFAAP
jgi:hypothetical protein